MKFFNRLGGGPQNLGILDTLYFSTEYGIELGATPKASGSSPPAVTFTGNLDQALGIYIQCDTAGTPGVGSPTFKWSLDGATFEETLVPIASTVLLGDTQIFANFPTAAYSTNNIYEATVAKWRWLNSYNWGAYQLGSAHYLQQSDATKQPVYSVTGAPAGRPCLIFDGVDDFLATPELKIEVTPPFQQLPQPNHLFIVGKWGGSGTGTMVAAGYSSDTSRFWRVDGTRANYGAGVSVTITGLTPDDWHVHELLFNGASSSYHEDGVQKANGDPSPGTAAFAGLAIGHLPGDTQHSPCSIAEVGFGNRALSSSATQLVRNALLAKYGFPG
jgi:hypothetical protein